MTRHLAAIYYQPQASGGDITVPLCRRWRGVVTDHVLTDDPDDLDCPRCVALNRGEVLPDDFGRLSLAPATQTPPHVHAIAEIAQWTAARWDLTVEELLSDHRGAYHSDARQEAMWLMIHAGYSMAMVSRVLRRQPSTIAHGLRRHEARLAAMKVAA